MTTADVTLLSLDRRRPFPSLPANSRWFFGLGVALVILGMIALSSAALASVATTLVIGFLLLIGGFGELIGVFWCRGAAVLSKAEKILILGSATGSSSAMQYLVAELKQHHREIAKRVVGAIVVDEQHMTEDQMLAQARNFFSTGILSEKSS